MPLILRLKNNINILPDLYIVEGKINTNASKRRKKKTDPLKKLHTSV
jgi:hypothetical protein